MYATWISVFFVRNPLNEIYIINLKNKFLNPLKGNIFNLRCSYRLNSTLTKMKYQLQVISTPSSDTGSSLCLFFPNARYIFGIPEGTTRMCIQRKQALKKLRGAFLSEPTDGGLAGLTMSFADTVGQGKLNVIGPEGTLHRVAGMRYYNKR